MNATINKGHFKNHIVHESHTKASTKDASAHGTDHADVKTTLPDVLVGTNGEIHATISWRDIEKPPKLMGPKLKIGKHKISLSRALVNWKIMIKKKIKFVYWISI